MRRMHGLVSDHGDHVQADRNGEAASHRRAARKFFPPRNCCAIGLRWNTAEVPSLAARIGRQATTSAAGQVLCRKGEPGNTAFIIKSGRLEALVTLEGVRASRGVGGMLRFFQPLVYRAQLTPEDLIAGEMACLSGSPRAADLTVVRKRRGVGSASQRARSFDAIADTSRKIRRSSIAIVHSIASLEGIELSAVSRRRNTNKLLIICAREFHFCASRLVR